MKGERFCSRARARLSTCFCRPQQRARARDGGKYGTLTHLSTNDAVRASARSVAASSFARVPLPPPLSPRQSTSARSRSLSRSACDKLDNARWLAKDANASERVSARERTQVGEPLEQAKICSKFRFDATLAAVVAADAAAIIVVASASAP